MNVLFTVWECDPFFKMGGLGDVARSLPGALQKLSVDVRIILPYYNVVKMGRNKKTQKAKLQILYGGKKETIEVWETVHPYTKVPVYFLKNKRYLDTVKGMDTWAFFGRAVVTIVKDNILQWQPEIIHTNDKHCGFIPLLVKLENLPIKTVFTIHNLAYQGKTSVEVIKKMGIDPDSCKALMWEIKTAQINSLLEGIVHADVITTVSPTYAKEILTEEFGAGLNDICRGREGRIFGILNGIDVDWRTMKADRAIKYPYGPEGKKSDNGNTIYHWKEGKKLNKAFLQKKLGLKVNPDIPLFCFIGRFDPGQKGLDILHAMLRRINQTDNEFIILGSGDKDWEERFQWLSTFYPKNVSCNFRFDEDLAHQIYAGSDFILIPSKFEPCGLIQMIAMLFGTIPIAHAVGGLKDSIQDGYNGFLFPPYSSEELERTVAQATALRKHDPDAFNEMVEHAMNTDFSWNKSAQEYLTLYEKLLADSF